MGKRKSEKDEKESAKKMKKSQKAIYTISDFQKDLLDTESQYLALKRFSQLAKSKKMKNDLVKSYISLSPDCQEFFQFLDKSKQQRPQVMTFTSIFHLF